MQKGRKNAPMEVTIVFLVAVFVSTGAVVGVNPYNNHTVGGDARWIFNQTTNTTNVNYTKWAANPTFALGDYLIFDTNGNSTVLQTYNLTSYDNCNIHGNDVEEFDGGGRLGEAASIAVPLVKEGDTYYFSGAFDGKQCWKGMKFAIKVVYGNGLPPELKQPPPSSHPLAPPPPIVPSSPSSQQETFHRGGVTRVEVDWVIGSILGAVVLIPVAGRFE